MSSSVFLSRVFLFIALAMTLLVLVELRPFVDRSHLLELVAIRMPTSPDSFTGGVSIKATSAVNAEVSANGQSIVARLDPVAAPAYFLALAIIYAAAIALWPRRERAEASSEQHARHIKRLADACFLAACTTGVIALASVMIFVYAVVPSVSFNGVDDWTDFVGVLLRPVGMASLIGLFVSASLLLFRQTAAYVDRKRQILADAPPPTPDAVPEATPAEPEEPAAPEITVTDKAEDVLSFVERFVNMIRPGGDK